MQKGLLVKYGEIAIRGKNRYLFENQLIAAIRKSIDGLDSGHYIEKEQGRFIIYNKNGETDVDGLIERVKLVYGVLGVSPCIISKEQEFETIKELALEYFSEHHPNIAEGTTFKVETRRAIKSYPLDSNEVSGRIGEYILENFPQLKVAMKNPDITLRVELRNDAYIYSNTIKGVGGLPAGSSGKGVLLLSGGIDSPVAGYLMEKRGVSLDGVYFHSPPYTSERAKEKVMDLASRLSLFSGGKRLYVMPFTEIQLYLYEHVQAEKLTIMLKRIMMRIGEMMALKNGGLALVMGDSVGQVASQTLRSINAVESAVSLPVLRPLAGFDKQEIIDLAVEIGTYDISIRPYEDCCTIFVAKHPETKPKASIIESIESRILPDLMPMIEKCIENAEIYDL
ncbi:tRNA 4-thiouridine(8) synthase ThiI [Tyzzerella sp. OttesenSCG-928-J15]|nr:tRNA 4-thiouridine(8) synthase ThiI [Tyzzerella sp. OttesenSCG-928-J15]